MITINATLGTGLYWRGGQILELGGPLAVLLSFLLVGFLSWAVMQCVTEMLCIWPIPGALSVYVSQFVDEELGIAVGVAYWYVIPISGEDAGRGKMVVSRLTLMTTAGSHTRCRSRPFWQPQLQSSTSGRPSTATRAFMVVSST